MGYFLNAASWSFIWHNVIDSFLPFSIPKHLLDYSNNRMLRASRKRLFCNRSFNKTNAIRKVIQFTRMCFFTFSSHTEYVKRKSIVIAWVKKNSLLLSWFVCLRRQNKPKKISVCLDVWMYVRTWTFHIITFEGVSGSKQNLVGVFYVWNVGLILKSKVI